MSHNYWNNEYEDYDGKYIYHTDDAILFLPEGFEEGEEVWLPLSQIVYDGELDEMEKGDIINIEVKNWLAEQEGLI
jgi:hypothetical protein